MKTIIAILLAIIAIAGGVYFWQRHQFPAAATNFEECAAQGNPVMESYPRQCHDQAGNAFREDIGNGLEKTNLVRATAPRPNQKISSPVTVKGEARGSWFFEASFPVKVLDEKGAQLGGGIAHAQGDWMTTDFVPFEAKIEFSKPTGFIGRLILEKDNPSGLPEHDDSLIIPVKF